MLQTVIIVVHLIVVLALIAVVLLQRSEGGLGLGGGGGGGGTSGFMTGRGQANALTRTTAILAALFFTTSLTLSVLATYGKGPRSVLDRVAPAGQQQAPAGGSVLDQLRQIQGDRPAGDAPAADPAPGAPAVPFQAPGGSAPQVPQSR